MNAARVIQNTLLAVGVAAALVAAGVALWQWGDSRRYEKAADELERALATVTEQATALDAGESPQAETPQASWPEDLANAVAWLTVDGVGIDLPVAMQSAEDPDYWLRRDLWGSWSLVGCPFVDSRCGLDGPHVAIYGHHISMTQAAFTPIYRAYEQQNFDKIGSAHLLTRDSSWDMVPLCALSVDEYYSPIQTFEFADTDALRSWVSRLAAQAQARSPTWELDAAACDKVLTLVTCSSDYSGQSGRTLVVFVHLQER